MATAPAVSSEGVRLTAIDDAGSAKRGTVDGGNDARAAILVLHPSDELYGADRVLLEVLDALAPLVRPIVVLPSDSPPGPLSAELARRGITVERVRFAVIRRRYLSPLGLARLGLAASVGMASLYRLARRHRVRAIHVNTSGILFGPLLAALVRVPWVWHLHEIIERPRWLRRFIGFVSARRGGHVVTVSRALALHLERCGGPAATVILNTTPPSPPEASPVTESKIVLMVGRVNGMKGHAEFTMAARLLHESGLDARFRMVGGAAPGSEDLYAALGQVVRELDPDSRWLEFAGYSSNVGDEMSRAAVVVVPSTTATGVSEGFNITALEAMARGRPVVASSVGGLPEVVVDGQTGLLVPAGDIKALAVAMRRMIDDPALARQMGENGRRRANTALGRKAFQAKWRRVYRRVLAPYT